MPTLQWLGTLEPRPSPIVQALNALQPGVDALAEWLRQQPGRERQMLQALSEFVQSLPDERAIHQFLDTIPPERRAALVEMAQRHGIGGFSLTPEGRLQVTLPVQALQRQQEWRMRRAEELLAPILGAPDEQREAWVASPEGQRTLQQVREFAPTLVIERQGRLEPVRNVDAILKRQLIGAQVESERALAGVRQAQEEEARALLAPRIAALRAETEQRLADAERTRALTPELVRQTRAETGRIQEVVKRMQTEHPFVARMLEAQLEEIYTDIATKKQLADAEVQSTLALAEERRRNAENLAYQLDWLRRTEPLRYQEMQVQVKTAVENLNRLVVQNEFLRPTLQAELDRLQTALQQDIEDLAFSRETRPIRVALLENQLKQAVFTLNQLKQEAPHRLELLVQQVENEKRQGRQIDAQTLLIAAEADLAKARAADIPEARALAWAAFRHQVSQDKFDNALRLRQQEFNERVTKENQQFQQWVEKNKLELEKRRTEILETQVGLEKEQSEREDDWRVVTAILQADALAGFEFLEQRGDIDPEVKQALIRSLKRETTMKAAQIAGVLVSDLIGMGRISPGNELTAWKEFAHAIAGEFFDEDGFSILVGASQKDPNNPEKAAKSNFGEAWKAGLFAIAVSGAIPALITTWDLWRQLGLPPVPPVNVRPPALPPGAQRIPLPPVEPTPALPGPGQTSIGQPRPAARWIPLATQPSHITLPQGDVIELPSTTWRGRIPKGMRFIDIRKFGGGLAGATAGLSASERGFLMPGEMALVWLNHRSGGRLGWLLNALGIPPEMQGVQQR